MKTGQIISALPPAFYARPTLEVARALLGKTLARRTDAGVAAGMIVEVEAYIAAVDAAAHGYGGPTPRTRSMFGPSGHAYVYRSYGMHFCLNVVTEPEGAAAAVLIRALAPSCGLELMRERRGPAISDRDLCRGPGRLCQALAITLGDDGATLYGPDPLDLWIAETPGAESGSGDPPIASSPRIGISKAVDLSWRFYVLGSRYVSGQLVRERGDTSSGSSART
jgi:DNA-3-methyladenine glycosylase